MVADDTGSIAPAPGAGPPGTGQQRGLTGGHTRMTGLQAVSGGEDPIRLRAELLRSQNLFLGIAEALPEGSAPRKALERVSELPVVQVLAFCFGFLFITLSFRSLIDPEAKAYEGLNFLLYLYLLTASVYFARFSANVALSGSVGLVLVAIFCYAFQLSGFRPSLYFIVTHPLLTLLVNLSYSELYDQVAAKSVLAERTQRELTTLETRQRGSHQEDEDIMRRIREAELASVKIKTHFSDLLNQLRDLGGAIREFDIHQTLFRILRKGTQAEAAEIWYLSDDGSTLKVEESRVAAGGEMTPSQLDASVANDGSTVLSYAARHKTAVLPDALRTDGTLVQLSKTSTYKTAFCFPIRLDDEVRAIVNVSRGPSKLEPEQVALLNTLAEITSRAFAGARTFQLSEKERRAAVHLSEKERDERIKTRETLERFVSHNVVDEVMANPRLSQSMETTILLADLRGFTTLSEKLEPEIVVAMLNDYFQSLTPLIFRYNGTLDKYIGDMVMALFGPPRPTGNDAEAAVRCAIDMQRSFHKNFRQKWEPRVQSKLEMGISLNTGRATVGLLGSDRLVNYTAIGDAVNTASRLEDSTPGGRIFVTEATFRKAQHAIEAKLIGAKAFKGKTEKTRIYEVRGIKADAAKAPSLGPSSPRTEHDPGSSLDSSIQAPRFTEIPSENLGLPPQGLPRPAPRAPAADSAASPATAPCPLCSSPVPRGSQSCPTCGMKL